jgi:subtilisin family serine protease
LRVGLASATLKGVRRTFFALVLGALGASFSSTSMAAPTDLAVRTLGAGAVEAIATTKRPFVLVQTPPGVDPVALGLRPVAAGIAVLDGDPARIAAFAKAHAGVTVELAPPLLPKLDLEVPFVAAERVRIGATLDGRGTYVGVVDTGIDVFHEDFRNADGTTRIAWLLDYSQEARSGEALDQTYGGRVFSRAEIDAFLQAGTGTSGAPNDDDGHGTHVAGIAASSGGKFGRFVGVAPGAELVIVRASDARGSIDEGRAVLGTRFVFDRAKDAGRPAVVNLSLGTQFGPHDGTSSFERALSVLAKGPGRAIVVASSNEGHLPIHTSVRVSPGPTFRIPIRMRGPGGSGRGYNDAQVFAYVNYRDKGELRLGVRGPDGDRWMPLVDRGQAVETRPADGLRVIVANDDGKTIASDARGAVMILAGRLPAGTVELELEGDGAVEIWLQGAREAIDGPGMPLFVRGGQIEGSVGIPASAGDLLAVGCVDARTSFMNRANETIAIDGAVVGRRCFFSSSGPSAIGVPRPDVLAPGYYVISSLARTALARSPGGQFSAQQIVDETHAALAGTSMSAPFGVGAAAILFQRDPTLDQEGIRAALMAGARPLVDEPPGVASPREYGAGAGILDVEGALAALDRRPAPPRAVSLRMRLGGSYLAADGGLPLYAIAQATDERGRPADVEGGLVLETEGARVFSALEHPVVGLYRFAVVAEPGRGGSKAELRLRGSISATREVAIAIDRWEARDGSTAGGGCSIRPGATTTAGASLAFAGLLTFLRRARSRSRATAPPARRGATAAPDRRR